MYTGRFEIVDPPVFAAFFERYSAKGDSMKGNRIAIVTDREADLIEVHPPSHGSVEMDGLTVGRCPQRPAMG